MSKIRKIAKYLKAETKAKDVISLLKHYDDPDSDYDSKELAMGIDVEKEHNDDIGVRKAIAKAHLAEIPDYYTRLKKMEDEATKKGD